jgi:L-iditol 2-dehydrogenase
MTYKAALFYGAENLEIKELSEPSVGAGEVLIKVEAANICPTDARKYRGLDERYKKLQEPIILGHEVAGTVINIGNGVNTIKIGDKVAIIPAIWCKKCKFCARGNPELCNNRVGIGASVGEPSKVIAQFKKGFGGAFAEILKVYEEQAIKIPANVSVKSASLAEPFADVIKAQDMLSVNFEDKVIIFGLGPMGLMHTIYSKICDAELIIGVDPIDERRRLAEKLGCNVTINPTEGYLEEIKKIVPEGADVIIVATGGSVQAKCIEDGIRVASKGARICNFAGTYPSSNISIDPNIIHYKQVMLTGSFAYNTSTFVKGLNLMSRKSLDLASLLRKPEFPLEKIKEAFEIYGSPSALKVGINP